MNPSQSKTTRYTAAALCGLALLLVIGWLTLRESPPPSPDLPPIRAVTVSPRIPLVVTDNTAPQETSTNQVAESAPIPTNAATLYRQAFAIYDALSKEQKDLTAGGRTNDVSVEAELCEKIQPICDLMHQAAATTNYDWGLGQPVSVNPLPPYLSPCRNLARAAVWSAAHCRTNDPSAAVEDLIATSRLGQNVSSPATLLAHLVDLAIQGLVIHSVAENASLLASADDTRLVELLSAANYDEGLRRAFEQEADSTAREADTAASLPPEEAIAELRKFFGLDASSSELGPMGPVQMIAYLRQAADLQRQYGQALEMPEAEYSEWLANLQAAANANPLVGMFVSSFRPAVDKTQAMTVNSAMAVAGLAVMQNGTDALPSHPDPTTGQPFAYKQTPDGFELESSFQVAEKSLKLSFK